MHASLLYTVLVCTVHTRRALCCSTKPLYIVPQTTNPTGGGGQCPLCPPPPVTALLRMLLELVHCLSSLSLQMKQFPCLILRWLRVRLASSKRYRYVRCVYEERNQENSLVNLRLINGTTELSNLLFRSQIWLRRHKLYHTIVLSSNSYWIFQKYH